MKKIFISAMRCKWSNESNCLLLLASTKLQILFLKFKNCFQEWKFVLFSSGSLKLIYKYSRWYDSFVCFTILTFPYRACFIPGSYRLLTRTLAHIIHFIICLCRTIIFSTFSWETIQLLDSYELKIIWLVDLVWEVHQF